MSVTIAHHHRPHLHIPWEPVLAVLVAVAITTVLLVLVNRPWDSTPADSSGVAAGSAATATWPEWRGMGRGAGAQAEAAAVASAAVTGQTIAVPAPESQVMLRHAAELGPEVAPTGGAAAVPKPEPQSQWRPARISD